MHVFMLYCDRLKQNIRFLYICCYVQESVTNGDEVKKPKRSKQEVCLCARDTTPHSHPMQSIVPVPVWLHGL